MCVCLCVCLDLICYYNLYVVVDWVFWFLTFYCLRNFVLLQFIECFKLLVSQKNNVCVCVCVCMWVGAWVRECVCVCVCTLLLLSIPCIWAVFSSLFYWVVDVLLLTVLNFLCKWRARKQISLHRDNKVVLYCIVSVDFVLNHRVLILYWNMILY